MAFEKMNAKEFWRLFGLFSALLSVLIGLNILFIKLSEKKWERGLREGVQLVLDQTSTINSKSKPEWKVGDNYKIDNPFYMSARGFTIISTENGRKALAVIIRTPTLYGPYPAVFIKEKGCDFEFAGYAGVNGRIKTLMEGSKTDIFISYWQNRLPSILNIKEGEK